jgi:putative ABC transport system substrate-binding protein
VDRRRFLLTSLAGALAAPLAAEAQQVGKVSRIALLFANTPVADIMGPTPKNGSARAFLEGMRALGWIDGTNITIERRSVEGQLDRYPALIQEFVGIPVDLIVTASSVAPQMIKEASATMPIVLSGWQLDSDALVRQRLIASIARPGGTVTGLVISMPGIRGKQLQLLKEAVPRASRIVYLGTPPLAPPIETAHALNLTLAPITVAAPEALDGAFATITRQGIHAILVGESPYFLGHRRRIADLAASHGLPAMYWNRAFPESGGLMSYGGDFPDLFRRAATYVDNMTWPAHERVDIRRGPRGTE